MQLYSNELIDSIFVKPDLNQMYNIEDRFIAWDPTGKSSFLCVFIKDVGNKALLYSYARDKMMRIAGIDDVPSSDDTFNTYLAFYEFDATDVDAVESAYYTLMSKTLTTLKIHYISACNKVFEHISDIVSDFHNAYSLKVINQYYLDIIDLAQHMSSYYSIEILASTNECRSVPIFNMKKPFTDTIVLYETDDIIIRDYVLFKELHKVEIIPKTTTVRDPNTHDVSVIDVSEYKARFRFLLNTADTYEMSNAVNICTNAIRTYINEEMYDIQNAALDMVEGLIKQFEFDDTNISKYFNLIIMMANNLNVGYKITYSDPDGGNTDGNIENTEEDL